MPTIKTYAPNGASGRNGVSERQRALAQMLAQEGTSGRAAAPAMPAGKAGLGLALGNAALSAVEGLQYKAQSDKEAAAQQASQERFGHMAKGYQDSLAPGVSGAGGGPGRAPSSLGGAIQGAGSSANAATAYRYFLDKGLPEASARALVGGFQQESGPGLNTGATNKGDGRDGSSSIGIGQWNSDRAAALQQFAAKAGRDPGDLRTQLDFTWSELNGPEKASLQRLMAATDDHSATAAAVGYERPAGYRVDNPEAAVTFGKRLANTTALAGLANEPGTAAPAAAPATATASADVPAANARPASAPGLPGDMLPGGGSSKPSIPMLSDYLEPDKSITPENQARYEADREAARQALASAGPQDGAAPTSSGDTAPGVPPQGASAPIPGSAFTPPADLEGGAIDANVATSPGSLPINPASSLRDTIAAAMQPSMPPPGLTPANPNAAPGALGQPSDMLNTAPQPGDGGMDATTIEPSLRDTIKGAMQPAPGLGMAMAAPQANTMPDTATIGQALGVAEAQKSGAPSFTGKSPYGEIPPGTGDPDAQSLATALQSFGSVPTPAGTDTPKAFAPLPDQAEPSLQSGTFGTSMGTPVRNASNDVADAQAAGMPSFTGLPNTNGKQVALSNSPDMGGGAPAPAMAADVPLPPQRPPQALIDMLAGGDSPSKLATPDAAVAKGNDVQVSTNRGPATIDRTSTGSIGPQGASVAPGSRPQPDVPAPNATPAMAAGWPASAAAGPGAGFSGVGKQATEVSPQAFNLQQSGGPSAMANILASMGTGSAPAAPSAMSPDQRAAMVSYLQDGSGPMGTPAQPPGSVGSGSAFRQGMDGGDLKGIAAKQYAALLGGGQDAPAPQPSPQTLAMAQQLDPRVIPAPADAPPAPGGGGSPAYLQEAAATLGDPYATAEMKAYAKEILDRQLPAKAEPYTLSAGQVRYDANNRQVAAVPKDQQDRYDYREVGGRLVAVNKSDPTDVRDATPAGMPSGYRPATPAERQAYGVGNGTPMVIGPDGKPSGLSGGTTVNVGGSEPASEKAYGEAQGKHFGDILNAGETARQTQGQLSLMNDAFNQGGGAIQTGPFAKSILAGKQAIQGITGIDLGGIPESEAVNKLGFGLATSLTKEITARPAQAEFLRAIQNVPGIFMSPQGSKVMMSVLNQQAQQKVDLGEMVQDPQNRANWPAVERQYYASHPLMSPFTGKPLSADDVTTLAGAAQQAGVDPTTGGRLGAGGGGGGGAPPPQAGTAAPQQISSKAAYDALPSGATFTAPDGSTRRKP